MGLLSYIPIVGPILETAVEEISKWSKRRDLIKAAELQARVAEINAKAEIAAYKVKADIEWDLKWAGQAESSWKDEWLMILWSIPMVLGMFCVFVPGLRDDLVTTLEFINGLNDQILFWYAGGWALIFGATFGYKGFVQMMVPNKVQKVADAFGRLADDIPMDAVEDAQNLISSRLNN